MVTPFPTDLTAAPSGGRVAWVSSNSGVPNILIAEPAPATANNLQGRGCVSPTSAGPATGRRSSMCAATAPTARVNRRTPRN
jgi:hypothetical protein